LASFADLIERLATFYGPLPPPPADPFACYVWEILGTRTTPGRRDAAMSALRRVPALTPDSLRKLPRGRLEGILRQCGPFVDERLAALDAGVAVFRRQPHLARRLRGPLRDSVIAARDLPHIGTAGALRLLMFTGRSLLIPVDGALVRVAVRLGLCVERANPTRVVREARRALDAALPGDIVVRRRAVGYLSHHAERTCTAATPHCAVCPLAADCPTAAGSPGVNRAYNFSAPD
jgi:endonuclease III